VRRAVTIAIGASAVMAAPVAAQQAARPVAGCIVAAANQQSRVLPDSEFHKTMDEVSAYWRAELARVQPDAAKQELLLAGAREALDKDLARMPRTDGMMHVGQILSLCRAEREKREAKP